MSFLLDAGPSLNFLAVGQENVLIGAATTWGSSLAVPANVDREITRQGLQPQFSSTAAGATWAKLKAAGRVSVLSDDITLAPMTFAAAIARIAGIPAPQRVKDQKSLGEIMVLAHASVLVQQGAGVFVLMDEQDGRERAAKEHRWLRGQRATGRLRVLGTQELLEQAEPLIRGGLTWRQVYERMRPFDRALPPL